MTTGAPQKQYVRLDQAAQGGLIDDIDVTILDAAWMQLGPQPVLEGLEAYQGRLDHDILILGIQFQGESGKTFIQPYSAGELTFFVPDDSGEGLIPVADKQMINDSTNAWKFISSLFECGFPPDRLTAGNIKAIVGTKVHVKQVVQPKRTFLIRGGQQQSDRDPTTLLVSAILSLPGEEQAMQAQLAQAPKAPAPRKPRAAADPAQTPATVPGATAGKPALGRPTAIPAKATGTLGAPATSRAAASVPTGKVNGGAGAPVPVDASDDDKVLATDILNEILAAHGGSIAKKELAQEAFQAAQARVDAGHIELKRKMPIVQLIFRDPFLHELAKNGLVLYDGATVSYPG